MAGGGGRKKTELKLIERNDSRLVCFSKLRSGLFKKVRELLILSGAQIGAIVFSPDGKPFVSDVATMGSLFGLEKTCEIFDVMEVNEPDFWWDIPLQGMGCEELLQLETRMLRTVRRRSCLASSAWIASRESKAYATGEEEEFLLI